MPSAIAEVDTDTVSESANDCSSKKGRVSSTMWAFALEKPGDQEGKVVRMPIPKPRPGEALVKVLRAGVCNTDLEILKGYMGFSGVLGHEFVGRVVDVNVNVGCGCDSGQNKDDDDDDDDDLRRGWIGARVCGDINVGCADCSVCFDTDNSHKSGRCPMRHRNHCPNRETLGILKKNGTMAEYLTLPITNLHKVPENVDDASAVFSEPLAAACRIVEQGLVRYEYDNDGKSRNGDRPDRVAILGDGKLGLMIAEVLGREHAQRFGQYCVLPSQSPSPAPAPPVLFGKHRHKLDLVEGSGVDCRLVSECVDDTSFSGVAAAHAALYDVVVDATGSPAGLKLAAGMCRPMGTLVLKSTCADGEPFNAAPIVIDELRVVGSRCGPIDVALGLLSDHKQNDGTDKETPKFRLAPLQMNKYVTKTFPLTRADEAIRCAAEKSTMKVQIICNDDDFSENQDQCFTNYRV